MQGIFISGSTSSESTSDKAFVFPLSSLPSSDWLPAHDWPSSHASTHGTPLISGKSPLQGTEPHTPWLVANTQAGTLPKTLKSSGSQASNERDTVPFSIDRNMHHVPRDKQQWLHNGLMNTPTHSHNNDPMSHDCSDSLSSPKGKFAFPLANTGTECWLAMTSAPPADLSDPSTVTTDLTATPMDTPQWLSPPSAPCESLARTLRQLSVKSDTPSTAESISAKVGGPVSGNEWLRPSSPGESSFGSAMVTADMVASLGVAEDYSIEQFRQ